MKSLILNIGEPAGLSHADFAEAEKIVKPCVKPMTYYVAKDADGNIGGTMLIKLEDRKAQGALVGNWIAQGYAVELMTYKELNKILRKVQADIDAAEKAEKERIAGLGTGLGGPAPATGGAAPATGEGGAGGAPASTEVGAGGAPAEPTTEVGAGGAPTAEGGAGGAPTAEGGAATQTAPAGGVKKPIPF